MPWVHSDETWETLLNNLAEGIPLAQICAMPDMPGTSTVYDRVEKDEQFAGRFRARKAIGVRAMADDCIRIADEPAVDATHVADKRVRIDTRLRLAGKWLAKEFGDKMALTDADGGPLTVQIMKPGD